MKIVICGADGDVFFSGESLLSNAAAAEGELADDFEPTESGVFPVSRLTTHESGIFRRNGSYDEASDAESLLEQIDFEWMLLSA